MNVSRYSSRHASGHYLVSDEEGRTTAEGETLSCVHCQRTWAIQPGSGRSRGFCFHCMGPTCGGAGCQTCTPFERRLEIVEQRHRLWRQMEGG